VFALFRILHFVGFTSWLIGLVGSTSTAAAARRGATAEARLTAWNAGKRLWGNEIVGMVLTPLGGLVQGALLAGGFAAMFRTPSLAFVHWKLLLVIVALAGNLVLFRMRRRVGGLLQAGGPELEAAYKPMAMVQGITTLMLPAALLVVVLMKYT
jgi:hypothetical protein